MTSSCPIPTPAQRRYGEIQERIAQEMMRKIEAAVREAGRQAQSEIEAAETGMPAPSSDYFAAVAHQKLFCLLCKADPDTFAGGRADIANAVIKNSRNIATHYWGAAGPGEA